MVFLVWVLVLLIDIGDVWSILLLVSIEVSFNMWLLVFLYIKEFWLEVLVFIILLMVVWLFVDKFGEKKKLWGCNVLFRVFLIILVCIFIYCFLILIFSILFIWWDIFIIILLVRFCLFVLVLLLWVEKCIRGCVFINLLISFRFLI